MSGNSENETETTAQSADSPGASVKASWFGLAIGLTVFVVMLLLPPPDELNPEAWHVAAVAVLMAIFWVTEALPLPVTALIPLAAFPLLGVMPIILVRDPLFYSMATVIAFGLAFGTVLSLLVVPVIYAIFFGVRVGGR